jgi:glycosyltransferase involved in cell wall biosynthesis
MVTGPGTDYNHGTLIRDSDRIIALSIHHTLKLKELFSPVQEKCSLIPPPPTITMCPEDGGATKARGHKFLGVKEEDYLFAYYGYVYPGKGVETLVCAFQNVARYIPNVRLVLIGGFLEHMGGNVSGCKQALCRGDSEFTPGSWYCRQGDICRALAAGK